MTIPLYETDSFLKKADATVTHCHPRDDGTFAIQLNQTIFFPEGGGQPGDTGTIDRVNVLDTYIDGDIIIHSCDAPLEVGKKAALNLNWDRRFDHMQQHTGEHMLSYAFWKLFGAVNVGFHMNEAIATLDLDRILTAEQIAEAERFANRQITEDLPIVTYVAPIDTLQQKTVRKISQKGGVLPRVVEIETSDICTCCGTHVTRTGQVGVITVVKWEKNRSGLRLTFLCGNRAITDMQQKNTVLHTLTALLSTDKEQLTSRIEELQKELQTTRRTLSEKNLRLLSMQAQQLLQEKSDSPYVLACLEDASQKEAKTMLNLLIQNQPVTAMVLYTSTETVSFLCGAHPKSKGQSCRLICDLLCGIFNCKGGGKDVFAQGGGKWVADYKQRAQTVLDQLQRMA